MLLYYYYLLYPTVGIRVFGYCLYGSLGEPDGPQGQAEARTGLRDKAPRPVAGASLETSDGNLRERLSAHGHGQVMWGAKS